jgi:hypothetical protein
MAAKLKLEKGGMKLKKIFSCIWDLLHHIDVGSSYFAMYDELHGNFNGNFP